MKTMELLVSLDNVKDAYVISAEEFRQGGQTVKRLPTKRIWLIAAAVALMLLLVGCAVVYMLRMQDLTVGEWKDEVPVVFDENGDRIPIETREPTILLSLQNTNMEALAEWIAFLDEYDKDGSIMTEADNSGIEWNIPEQYHLTYGCYSQEMVDKLDEIVEKYNLKLLSEYITFEWYESGALLNSLSLDALVNDETGVEYWDGELHLEGTFAVDMTLNLDMGEWSLKENWASYRYSVKEYFDILTGGMKESQTYTQWNYTRKDGITVLLILNENTARIYADLPEAFISVHIDPVIVVDGEEVSMTQEALEQMAEFFNLSIRPQPTTIEIIEKHKAEAQAVYDAAQAEKQTNHEAQYETGYEEFVQYRLETLHNPQSTSYLLFDVNGDGVQELIIGGLDILSMKDGESYRYFDLTETGVLPAQFRPCEGNVFEVYSESEFFKTHMYFFYQANEEAPEFITGVSHDTSTDTWYRNLSDGMDSRKEQITAEEAQKILDSYTRIDFDWLPLKKFGEAVLSITYTDPYARYIANKIERLDDAVDYAYTLMDLNGDGIDELITRENSAKGDGTKFPILCIHSIKDGELWDMDINGFNYVCEGGILETAEKSDNGGVYHMYSRVTANGVEDIEKVVREPYYLYWGHALAGQEGKSISEEKAMSIINSYKRVDLDMKPFSEYPFQ